MFTLVRMDEAQSRDLQRSRLEKDFPAAKEHLDHGEILLAVSKRLPQYVTGIFCVLVGVFFIGQITAHFLLKYPLPAVPALLISILLVWLGLWFVFLAKCEYVFVTDQRIVHQKINMLGKARRRPFAVSLSDIQSAHLYRNRIMLFADNGTGGDILLRKKSGGTYLVPTLSDGVTVAEALIAQLQRCRALQENSELSRSI